MEIVAKKIDFNLPGNIKQCVHDVISVWLRELDEEKDPKIQYLLRQKVMELEQVINRTSKPQIHFYPTAKIKIRFVDQNGLDIDNDIKKNMKLC